MKKNGLGSNGHAIRTPVSDMLANMRSLRLFRRGNAHEEFAAYARDLVTWPKFTRPLQGGLQRLDEDPGETT